MKRVFLVVILVAGSSVPAAAGNPRPFGMLPDVLQLADTDVAAVLTHLRTSWGNKAPAVNEVGVLRERSSGARQPRVRTYGDRTSARWRKIVP